MVFEICDFGIRETRGGRSMAPRRDFTVFLIVLLDNHGIHQGMPLRCHTLIESRRGNASLSLDHTTHSDNFMGRRRARSIPPGRHWLGVRIHVDQRHVLGVAEE